MIAEMIEMEQKPALSKENYWQAVLNRDSRGDGVFVYAVRSTGIYCRPSCSSRRPRPEQVAFFDAPELAEQAGFRACQRCQPQAVKPEIEPVQKACRYIEQNFENQPSLNELSDYVGLSPQHFQRLFKRMMGISPRQYVEACRIEQLKARLREGDAVTNALYEVGYGSSSRLYERAPVQLGMTPAAYRKGGPGQIIGYIITDCPLGRLLVAATERGVCAVNMGEDDAMLLATLEREYPAAQIGPGNEQLNDWVEAILRYLNNQQPDLNLPLDVQATAFQWRVWQELRNIPYGSTRSYHEVAEAIGEPKATRAVARACATNKVALVIPCHRVVRENGDLGGYRWGLERKRTLLNQEKAAKKPEQATA